MTPDDHRRLVMEIAALLEYAHRMTPEQAQDAAGRAAAAIVQAQPQTPRPAPVRA